MKKELSLKELPSPLSSGKLRNDAFIRIEISAAQLLQLLELRCCDTILIELTPPVPIKKRSDLRRVYTDSLKETILRTLPLLKDEKRTRTYATFIKADADNDSLYRRDIRDIFCNWMQNAFPRWKYQDPGSKEFWGIYSKQLFSLNLRLKKISGAHEYRSSERQGSLKPSLAAAMAIVAGPADIIVDPMCGSGTLLFEHQLLYGLQGRYIGGDKDSEAVELAKRNALSLKGEYHFHQWDALKDLHINSVDLENRNQVLAISNLPFGKQFLQGVDLIDFYSQFFHNLLRSLPSIYRIVVLVTDKKALESALKKNNLIAQARYDLVVRGLKGAIYRIDVSSSN